MGQRSSLNRWSHNHYVTSIHNWKIRVWWVRPSGWISLWEWVWSDHKSEESSSIFVDPLRSPSRHSYAGCMGYRSQPHPSVPLCSQTAHSACWQKVLWSKWARLAETNYFHFLRLFGSLWPRLVWKQLQQQLGSRAVGEGALTSAKGWSQAAGDGWRQQPLQLTQGHLEREHKHQVSLTGGAQFELITSQAISHQLITTFGYCGSDWFRQEARAEILCLR